MRHWLKSVRIQKGLTQSALALLVDVDTTTISKYELGKRNPTIVVAKAIAQVLGFHWTKFFENGEERI